MNEAKRNVRLDRLVCRCGHAKNKHYRGRGICEAENVSGTGVSFCDCRRFRHGHNNDKVQLRSEAE
jgi:hypothetical protein